MIFLKKRRSKAVFGNGPIGTEAMAVENVDRNAKAFHYPPQGFLTRIEHSLLYSMILEPSIFPPEAVMNIIAEEDLEQYLYARPPPKTSLKELPVSYAQLTAMLVLAGEEWDAESKIPQVLCDAIVKTVLDYAERRGLDRRVETQELVTPLLEYSQKRGDKVTLSTIVPIYIGGLASVATGTPIPFWITYVASFAANRNNIRKEVQSDCNLLYIQSAVERASIVEHESLLLTTTTESLDDYAEE
eukprot:scaffold8587_cov97-Cylindrotheca_fusiformis.AAC.8